MTTRCEFCGRVVNPNSDSVYRQVIGWERHRQQGGTNALRLRQPQDKWACMHCVDKQARGIAVEQGELL